MAFNIESYKTIGTCGCAPVKGHLLGKRELVADKRD